MRHDGRQGESFDVKDGSFRAVKLSKADHRRMKSC